MADFEMPADLKDKSLEDVAKMYSETRAEYDKFKGEWEPRAKQWEEWSALGDPTEIKKVIDWGKSVAPVWQRIAQGEAFLLNDADYKAYKNWSDKTKNGTVKPDAVASDDDLFAPVKKSLAEELRAEMDRRLDERVKGFDSTFKNAMKGVQDQLNLYGHVAKLQKQHPNLDFDSLLRKGADLAQMPADQLLNSLIESETKLSGMEAEIDKRVAAKLAEKDTEKNDSAAKALIDGRRSGGNLPLAPRKRQDVMKGLIGDLGKRFPGLLEQVPLT